MAGQSSSEEVYRINRTPNQDPWMTRHVLTFDGGGVRGYFSLLCIQRLMHDIAQEERRRDATDPLGEIPEEGITSFYPCQSPPNVSHLQIYSPFLPCHYFDYVAGTSTGGLIAIMLGRFRMPVEDCIHEYQHLAVRVCKYSTKNFKRVIKDVVRKREELKDWNPQDARFDIEIGLCQVFVVANRTGPNGTVVAPWVFRSYEMRHDASRANRGGRPGDICVWQVARATTAAPMYFKPYELKTHGNLDGLMGRPPFHRDTTMDIKAQPLQGNVNSTGHKETTGPPVVRLEDGGFGTANNPAKYMLDELKEQLPEGVRVGTFVSVGTARPRVTAKGSPLLRFIKGAIHCLGDPEGTHEYMMRQATDSNAPFSYYRLNSPGEPSGVEMDDWKPRATGEDTMKRMKIAFNHYFVQPEVSDLFRTCAEKLVEARRARVRANRPKWDRYALGRHFYCKKEWNCHDEVQREINEVRFRAHLKDAHGMRNEDIDDAVNGCKHQWNYRG